AVAFRDQAGTDQWQREGLTDWTWDRLPEAIELQRGGMTFQAYPAVIAPQEAVGLRLFDSLDEANEQTRRGLRRLFLMGNAKAVRTQVDWLPELDRHLLNLSTLRSPGEMRNQLVELIADRALWGQDATIPREEAAYRQFLKLGRSRIRIAAQEVNDLLGPLAAGWQAVKLFLEQRHPPVWEAVVADVRSQVEHLFGPRFLTATPWPWLTHIPRYLDAIQHRVEKLSGGGLDRDRRLRGQ